MFTILILSSEVYFVLFDPEIYQEMVTSLVTKMKLSPGNVTYWQTMKNIDLQKGQGTWANIVELRLNTSVNYYDNSDKLFQKLSSFNNIVRIIDHDRTAMY